MKLTEVYYDRDWYDFTDGGFVSETTINMWIQQGLAHLRNHIKQFPDRHEYFHTISTGNTKLLIEVYRQHTQGFTVYLSVATQYKLKSATSVEL